jgi:hypothetical protein
MIKTTAMFSAHTLHVLHVVVRDFFIFLFVLLAAGFFWLIHGITIEKLTFGQYEIDGLYIKLDKKLILNAQTVIIPQSKSKPSLENVDKTFDRIKNILTYFESIYLEKVNFQNNHFTIFYADDVLYITSDDYEVAGNIERRGKKLIADVSVLHIKAYDTMISGKLSYDLASHILETGGKFKVYGIEGHFRVVKKGDEVVYALNSEPFTDLKPLIKRIHMPSVIEAWVIEKVKAKSYKVDYIKGKFSLNEKDISAKLAGLKAKACFRDVDIRYKEGVEPVHAKEMFLTYQKGNLYFDLVDPRHKDRSAEGTTVVIKHIVGGQAPVLILDLHVQSQMDEEVQKILKAYHLDIPVSHTGKKNQVVVNLKIPLGYTKKKMKVRVDVSLDEGLLKLPGLDLHVKSGRISYQDGNIVLKEIMVSEPWLQTGVDGTIDVRKKQGDFLLHQASLSLGEKKAPFFLLKEKKLPMKLSYASPVTAELPTLKTNIVQGTEGLEIHLADLKRVLPYLGKNIVGITGGNLDIYTKDMNLFRFKGDVNIEACFFYSKSDICHTFIPLEGTVNLDTKEMDVYAFGKRLHYNSKKEQVVLKDLNIDLKLFIQEQKRVQKSTQKGPLLQKKMVIIGKHSELRYDKYRLITDSYDIEVYPNGDIKAIGSSDGDVIKFTKKGSIFSMQALRIKDKMLHPLINFTGLKQGRYSLKKEGDPSKQMKGRILIEGGVLSDFKAYSNTLAFINTLPALATLHSPGFSNKGFKIEEGVIEYTMTPEKIIFDSVYLKGNSATVVGTGEVDLKTKKLNINLAIRSVREFGKMVGKIPLLGYILMGDDNSMTVGLKVTGTLDDPKVNTSVAKDILTLPLQILQRTITAPAHMGTFERKAPDIPDFNRKEKQNIPVSGRKKATDSTAETKEFEKELF